MKACDINLDLEEVCAKVRPSLAAKICYSYVSGASYPRIGSRKNTNEFKSYLRAILRDKNKHVSICLFGNLIVNS